MTLWKQLPVFAPGRLPAGNNATLTSRVVIQNFHRVQARTQLNPPLSALHAVIPIVVHDPASLYLHAGPVVRLQLKSVASGFVNQEAAPPAHGNPLIRFQPQTGQTGVIDRSHPFGISPHHPRIFHIAVSTQPHLLQQPPGFAFAEGEVQLLQRLHPFRSMLPRKDHRTVAQIGEQSPGRGIQTRRRHSNHGFQFGRLQRRQGK